jgi:hypothetical protein
MNLTDLASIGSLINGLAVLCSLIFLNLQTRQSTRNQKSLIQQERTQMASDWLRATSQTDFVETYLRGQAGDTTLNARDYTRYTSCLMAALFGFENAHVQQRMGALYDTEFALDLSSLKYHCGQPGFRAFWSQARNTFESSFRSVVDDLIRQTPVRMNAAETSLDAWRALVLRESGERPGQLS